jgi:beta-aspartyl-dipeptidase (metallo-type)
MFTLIEQGEVYGPEPLGKTSVLLNAGAILKIGEIDASSVERLGLPLDVINASGCIVTPALIDPHEHLLGGSGEEGN